MVHTHQAPEARIPEAGSNAQDTPRIGGADPGHARVIALLSAKGGCGATLLTVNLAGVAAEAHRPCVIDADFCKGDAAAYLDLWPRYTLHDALEAPTADGELLRGLAAQHSSGVAVLGQSHDLSGLEMPDAAAMQRLIEASRAAWDVVLADCGSRVDDATMGVALAADLVVVVTRPDVPALRDAGRVIDLLRSAGVPKDRLRLVVNFHRRLDRVNAAEIADQLGLPVFRALPEDRSACQRADSRGALLKDVAPISRITEDLRDLWDALDDGALPADARAWRLPWSLR